MLPRPPAASGLTLRVAQNACYEALSLALKEGQVFAALTGPEGCGKTVVLDAVMADRKDRALRFIRIADADKVPASLADQIEQVAYAEAGKLENLERHVVLAVDDAHTASDELLQCLSRLAAMREPGRRIPQILLVGRPELWTRLACDEYEPLARRLAIRAALPAAEDDSDPWASVESDITQTMAQLRAEAELMPIVRDAPDLIHEHGMHFEPGYGFATATSDHRGGGIAQDDEVSPPDMFALFADPPPKANRSVARDTRRRLIMPLVSLFVGLAAFAFALSFYDWPDLLGDMPWSDSKPTPFTLQRSPQSPSFGLPQPPSVQQTPKTASAPNAGTTTPPTPVRPPVAASSPRAPSTPAATLAAPAPAVERPSPATVIPAPSTTPASTDAPAKAVEPPMVAAKPAVSDLRPTPILPESSTPPAPARPRPLTTMETALPPTVVSLLLKRGDEEFAIGDISAARLFYERAAEANNAIAARQMARTFDSAFLPAAVDAALADTARARQWYQRAASLGNPEAAARLKTLGQGR